MDTAVEVNINQPEIDSLLESVNEKKKEWAVLPIKEKIELLK